MGVLILIENLFDMDEIPCEDHVVRSERCPLQKVYITDGRNDLAGKVAGVTAIPKPIHAPENRETTEAAVLCQPHPDRRVSTGFTTAVAMAFILTVTRAMTSARTPAIRNHPRPISTRQTKFCNQLLMVQ